MHLKRLAPGITTEVDFVRRHPSCPLSEQNLRILELLSQQEFTSGASQYCIATTALGLDHSFQPDVDTHVRVAVSRLRKSLEAFYAGPGAFRPRKLTIPTRKYCLVLCENAPGVQTSARSDAATPGFAWTVSPDASLESRELAFTLERSFSDALADAPLIHDGAIRSERLPAQTIKIALERARDASIGYLAQFVVRGFEQQIKLVIWSTAEGRPINETVLGVNLLGLDAAVLSTKAMVHLTDPITGVLPSLLAASAPKSRLAVVMTFFRFMATQDRSRLVPSIDCLNDIKGTHLDSPLTMSLRVDAARANYCFATRAVDDMSEKHLEEAEQAAELDPFQPYAYLARSYYEMMLFGGASSDPVMSNHSRISWAGSAKDDLELLRTLVSNTKEYDSEIGETHSFFTLASGFLNSFAKENYSEAEAFTHKMQPYTNFWTGAFQCAVAVELGRMEQATRIFANLQVQQQGIEDFAGRALVSMIPDKHVSGRICSNLAAVF